MKATKKEIGAIALALEMAKSVFTDLAEKIGYDFSATIKIGGVEKEINIPEAIEEALDILENAERVEEEKENDKRGNVTCTQNSR